MAHCDETSVLCNHPTDPVDPPAGSIISQIAEGTAAAVDAVTPDVGTGIAGDVAGEAAGAAVGVAGGLAGEAATAVADVFLERQQQETEGQLTELQTEMTETASTFDGWIDTVPFLAETQGSVGWIIIFGFVAAIVAVMFKQVRALADFGGRFLMFLIVSTAGVTLIVGGTVVADSVMLQLIGTEPAAVDLEGTGMGANQVASMIAPLVVAVLSVRQIVLAALIPVLIVAAALSTLPAFRRALPVVAALVIGTLLWPVLTVAMANYALAQLPSLGATAFLLLIAGVLPLAVYGGAIAAVSRS